MPHPFTNPSPEAQRARRKISKVHSTVQREALSSMLELIEGVEERMQKAADMIEEIAKGSSQ